MIRTIRISNDRLLRRSQCKLLAYISFDFVFDRFNCAKFERMTKAIGKGTCTGFDARIQLDRWNELSIEDQDLYKRIKNEIYSQMSDWSFFPEHENHT